MEEEALDPRIQVELEKLNTCSDEINKREKQFDEANAKFRVKFAEYSQKLDTLSKKIGKRQIDKARPYYVAKEIARLAQQETQKAAVKYQRAVTAHESAKDAINAAEQRFLNKQEEFEFNSALQDMLNHITMKVVETETNKRQCEEIHEKKAETFVQATQRLQYLEKELKTAITKSRPYFIFKEASLRELEDLKKRIEQLQKIVNDIKANYSESLHNLEVISEEIHTWRLIRQPREPGVGAEKENIPEDMLGQVDGLLNDFKLQ